MNVFASGQISMELNPPSVANEATSAESDVVTLARHEETPVTKDISMRGSIFSGEYPFNRLNNVLID